MVLRVVRPRSIKVRRAALRPVLGRVGNSHKSPARKPVYMNQQPGLHNALSVAVLRILEVDVVTHRWMS